jgi:ABC-type nitrate/sulfonate/bicarbonate transport system substrate-binding protein
VQIVQTGGSSQAYPALKAGRLAASTLTSPFSFQAREEGLSLLGAQRDVITPLWPFHVMYAKERFIAEYPGTIQALLRGYVRATRLARAEPQKAYDAIVTHLKFPEKYAKEAYEEVMPYADERGKLPPKESMDVFWQITIAQGDVQEPWPEEKYLDSRFISTFDTWAPG